MREAIRYRASFISPTLARLYLRGRRPTSADTGTHLAAAADWLCRAQDASGSGGVSRGYSLVYDRRFGRGGWQPAYPETTGYIIPTLFDYAHFVGREELFARALRMADWECDLQMPGGAVQGGTVFHEPSPAIFNTGQVIFGWVRAWQESGRSRYLESAIRAGTFLVRQQDPDGAWRRNLSMFASPKIPSYTYNTRTAWALLVLSNACGNREFGDAAVRNVEYALTQQTENGYFWNNCLDASDQALLHTIAYCLRGILEVGILAKHPRFMDSVVRAARPLLRAIRADGSLPGRFDAAWKPAVRWSCLTGNSQLALTLGRLYQAVGDVSYVEGMKTINRFQRSVQILEPRRPDLHGGICGSHPIYGAYARFEIPSWAPKFMIDAEMVEIEIAEGRTIMRGLPDRKGIPAPPSAKEIGTGNAAAAAP